MTTSKAVVPLTRKKLYIFLASHCTCARRSFSSVKIRRGGRGGGGTRLHGAEALRLVLQRVFFGAAERKMGAGFEPRRPAAARGPARLYRAVLTADGAAARNSVSPCSRVSRAREICRLNAKCLLPLGLCRRLAAAVLGASAFLRCSAGSRVRARPASCSRASLHAGGRHFSDAASGLRRARLRDRAALPGAERRQKRA